MQKSVFLKVDKNDPNLGAEVSLKSKADCSLRVMTPGYADVTFTIDFAIFSISRVSQVVHVNFTSVRFRGNFKHYDWPHLIPCTNSNTACLIFYTLDKDDDGFFTKASSN